MVKQESLLTGKTGVLWLPFAAPDSVAHLLTAVHGFELICPPAPKE